MDSEGRGSKIWSLEIGAGADGRPPSLLGTSDVKRGGAVEEHGMSGATGREIFRAELYRKPPG